MTVWDQVKEAFHCECKNTVERYKVDSLGRKHYRRMCVSCGRLATAAFSVKDRDPRDVERIPEYDDTRFLQYQAAQRQYYEKQLGLKDREIAKEKEIHKEKYYEYLRSPEWRAKREKVLQRDKFICQGCLNAEATEVHHLTYDHVFNEFLFELTSLCRECHERLRF